MNVNKFDEQDKKLYAYSDKTDIAEVDIDGIITLLIRYMHCDMYRIMEMLETEEISVELAKRIASIVRELDDIKYGNKTR